MRRFPFPKMAYRGRRDQREAGFLASLHETRLLKQVPLPYAALELPVRGRAIAADQRGVKAARMAGEFDHVSRYASEPAAKEVGIGNPRGVGDAGQPVVAGKPLLLLQVGVS